MNIWSSCESTFSQFRSRHKAPKAFFIVCVFLKSPPLPRRLRYARSTICKVGTLLKKGRNPFLYIKSTIPSRNKSGVSRNRPKPMWQSTEDTELESLSRCQLFMKLDPLFSSQQYDCIYSKCVALIPFKSIIRCLSSLLSGAITWHFPKALVCCCCLIMIHFHATFLHSTVSCNRADAYSPFACPGPCAVPAVP